MQKEIFFNLIQAKQDSNWDLPCFRITDFEFLTGSSTPTTTKLIEINKDFEELSLEYGNHNSNILLKKMFWSNSRTELIMYNKVIIRERF